MIDVEGAKHLAKGSWPNMTTLSLRKIGCMQKITNLSI
jgi:hypothetical protein